MFGTNPVAKRREDDGTYAVQEVFYTIQGEGPYTGMPAVFVRLSGCNLRCSFCDTDFTSSTWQPTLASLVERIEWEDRDHQSASLVVITGGEPMLQEIGPLVTDLVGRGHQVQIETAGTVWPSTFNAAPVLAALHAKRLTIVCSPKTGAVHKRIEETCQHWKYIIGHGTLIDHLSLPLESSQPGSSGLLRLFRPEPLPNGSTIWVQPMEHYDVTVAQPTAVSTSGVRSVRNEGASRAALLRCVNIAMAHGYRLSLQTHKILGLP